MEILNTVQYGTIGVDALLKIINDNRDRRSNEWKAKGFHQVGCASEEITLKEYKGFKVGDEVIIIKKPYMWNASAGSYPYDKLQIGQTKCVEKYPYTAKVKALTTWFKSNDSGKYALIALGGIGVSVGGYGFDLCELIERKLIKSKHVDLGDPSSLCEGDDTILDIKDLVIGKAYKIKSFEWIESKGDKFNNLKHNWANTTVYLKDIVNTNKLELTKSLNGRQHDYLWNIEIDVIKEIKDSLTFIDPLVTKAINKLKKEKIISAYSGGPGGGTSVNINTTKESILPAFNADGTQGISLHVNSCKRTFSVDQINELFKKGETHQSFRATQYSTITTSLSLIKDKKKLPKESSWNTMRD